MLKIDLDNFGGKCLERGRIFNKKQRANAVENILFTRSRFESYVFHCQSILL